MDKREGFKCKLMGARALGLAHLDCIDLPFREGWTKKSKRGSGNCKCESQGREGEGGARRQKRGWIKKRTQLQAWECMWAAGRPPGYTQLHSDYTQLLAQHAARHQRKGKALNIQRAERRGGALSMAEGDYVSKAEETLNENEGDYVWLREAVRR